jgi:hypothetical protein
VYIQRALEEEEEEEKFERWCVYIVMIGGFSHFFDYCAGRRAMV